MLQDMSRKDLYRFYLQHEILPPVVSLLSFQDQIDPDI
jgi:hypothetical protein